MKRWGIAGTGAAASLALAFSAASAAAAVHGCFEVTAPSLNIREGAFSSSDVIGTARRGEILIKRRPWCTWRGYWCAVRTQGGVEGWADKAFMEKVDCPSSVLEDE